MLVSGVSLIVEAVLDIVTIFLAYIGKKVVEEIVEEAKEEKEIIDVEVEDEVSNTESNDLN